MSGRKKIAAGTLILVAVVGIFLWMILMGPYSRCERLLRQMGDAKTTYAAQRFQSLYAKFDCPSAFSRLPTHKLVDFPWLQQSSHKLADFPWLQQSSHELVDFRWVKRRPTHERVYENMLELFNGKEPEKPALVQPKQEPVPMPAPVPATEERPLKLSRSIETFRPRGPVGVGRSSVPSQIPRPRETATKPLWPIQVYPTPTSTPHLSRPLIYGLLHEYVSDISNPGWKCMTYLTKPEALGLGQRYAAVRTDVVLAYARQTGKWTGRLTGDRCKGVESWEIDDATGAIKYVGSSTAP